MCVHSRHDLSLSSPKLGRSNVWTIKDSTPSILLRSCLFSLCHSAVSSSFFFWLSLSLSRCLSPFRLCPVPTVPSNSILVWVIWFSTLLCTKQWQNPTSMYICIFIHKKNRKYPELGPDQVATESTRQQSRDTQFIHPPCVHDGRRGFLFHSHMLCDFYACMHVSVCVCVYHSGWTTHTQTYKFCTSSEE